MLRLIAQLLRSSEIHLIEGSDGSVVERCWYLDSDGPGSGSGYRYRKVISKSQKKINISGKQKVFAKIIYLSLENILTRFGSVLVVLTVSFAATSATRCVEHWEV